MAVWKCGPREVMHSDTPALCILFPVIEAVDLWEGEGMT